MYCLPLSYRMRGKLRIGIITDSRLQRGWHEVRPVPVRTFACTSEQELQRAWAAVAERDAPVLFRGVGAHWPALRTWTLPSLRKGFARAMVRVSPSSQVTFCKESRRALARGAVGQRGTAGIAVSRFF